MSIAFMRQGTYPGSDIVIVKELARGSNYRRYYAYYLSEGLKIYALLTVPNGDLPSGGFPAIVFNHGYIPPDVYRTTERYIAYVDRLARAGYVVFRIDYRGNDKSEGQASGAYGNPGYTIDVLNAIASIKRYPRVNPQKIGMWGHSMGGYLTLRAMVISKDIKVGVIWAGVVASYPEMLYNWRRTGSFTPSPSSSGVGWRTGWIETYGTPEQNPAFWASVSANSYLADLSGPLQLHHGTADEDVPLDFSIRLAEQVRTVGGEAELYTYEKDNHNISKYFNLAMDRTIAFFDKILK
jgi:dipeptidyl aminopeptidase/acylaminoacyl peptidase